MVHGLVNHNVHLVNEDAVSWHAITLLNVNDVTDDEIFELDGVCGAVGSSINNDLLLVHLVLQTKELFVLAVVADGTDQVHRE